MRANGKQLELVGESPMSKFRGGWDSTAWSSPNLARHDGHLPAEAGPVPFKVVRN